MGEKGYHGEKYAVLIGDDYTKMKHVYPIKSKSETPNVIKQFLLEFVEKRNYKCDILYCDNAAENCSREMQKICDDNLITLRHSMPYVSETNGKAERQNGVIRNTEVAIRVAAGLPNKAWSETIKTAVFIENLLPTNANPGGKSPADMLLNYNTRKPEKNDLSYMRAIGCLAFVHKNKVELRKMDPKARPGILIGYTEAYPSYRILMNIQTGEIIETRNVTFIEKLDNNHLLNTMPGLITGIDQAWITEKAKIDARMFTDYVDNYNLSNSNNSYYEEIIIPYVNSNLTEPDVLTEPDSQKNNNNNTYTNNNNTYTNNKNINTNTTNNNNNNYNPFNALADENDDNESNNDDAEVQIPVDNDENIEINNNNNSNNNDTSSKSNIENLLISELKISRSGREIKPTKRYSPDNNNNIQKVKSVKMSFNTLMKKHNYADATRKELKDIIESNIGTIVETPSNIKPIGTTWVFKEKDDGTVKARLAPHGYEQAAGKDYNANEVEAPTLHWITVMIIFIIIMALGLSFKIGDVIGAFKLPDLKDSVYLKLPSGMIQNNKLSVKLNKALYGLKQAAHHFHQLLHTLLTEEMEFKNAYFFDGCLYYKNTTKGIIIIGVYVDDIIIATKDINIIDDLFNKINKKLPLQFKEQQSYLGVEINYSKDAILLSNTRKIEELIIRYKLEDAAPHDTPVAPGTKLYKSNINEPVYKFPYIEN